MYDFFFPGRYCRADCLFPSCNQAVVDMALESRGRTIVILFDELDAWAGRRGVNGEHEASRRLKAQFLLSLDTLLSYSQGQEMTPVFIVATTNRPWDLDDAVVRRFDKRIHIPLPNASERQMLFRHFLRSFDSPCVDWDAIAHVSL